MRQINPDQFISDDDYSPELAPGTEDGLSHGAQWRESRSLISCLFRDTFSLSVKRDECSDGWRCHRLILPLVGGVQSFCLQSTVWASLRPELSISPEKILYTIYYYYYFCKDITLLPFSLSVVGGRTIITSRAHQADDHWVSTSFYKNILAGHK